MTTLQEHLIYCSTESAWKIKWSATDLVTCPTNAAHTVVSNSEYIRNTNNRGNAKYYEIDSGQTIAIGDVCSTTPTGKLVKGFGYPTKYTFESKSAALITATDISSTQFVVVYQSPMDTVLASAGYAVVGTISGTGATTSVTYGTPVKFSGTSTISQSLTITPLSSTDVLICYRGPSGQGYATIGGVSGTGAAATIAFNTPAAFNAASTGDQPQSIAVAKLSSTQVVVVFRDTANSNKGTWIVGTVSGTGSGATIAWNTKAVFNNATTAANQNAIVTVALDSTRFIVFYDNNSTQLDAVIGTVSGTGSSATITSGTVSSAFNSSVVRGARDMACDLLTTDTVVLAYRQTVNNISQGYAVIVSATPSSTAAASQAITYGTSVTYTDSIGTQTPALCVMTSSLFHIVYINGGDNNAGETAIATVSGTTITMQTKNYVFSSAVQYPVCFCMSSSETMIVFRDLNYFNNGCAMYMAVTNNAPNFYETKGRKPIGAAEEAGTAGDVISVRSTGNMDVYSNLRSGFGYYAHGNGTLSTTNLPTDNSYDPTKVAIADSSTNLIVNFKS